jgi:sugar lactone lactonase YvrE
MKRILRNISVGLVLVIAAFIMYLLLWPVKIDPVAWTPPEIPATSGVFTVNDRLNELEKLAEGYFGPESAAIDSQGRIYTGLFDGRILRINPYGNTIEVFAQAHEPLGLKFDGDGNLIVADATLGLIFIDELGNITILANQVNGTSINFADDLVIASDGKIYFSDASTKFTNLESFADIFEHRPNGRLLVFEPATGETQVLLDELYFPNGVVLGPDESFLLFSETSMYRIRRYWLSGDKEGQVDIFIDNLPGFPDNITFNGENTYWVALAGGPKSRATLDPLLPHPFLRKVLWRLPWLFSATSTGEGYVLGLDLEGVVIHTLQDPTGETYPDTTSVIEHHGVLYIGSYSADGLGCIPVP